MAAALLVAGCGSRTELEIGGPRAASPDGGVADDGGQDAGGGGGDAGVDAPVVVKCTQGAPAQMLAVGVENAWVAVDASRAYFVRGDQNGEAVWGASTYDGTLTRIVSVPAQAFAAATMDATSVYVYTAPAAVGEILRVPLSGAAPTVLASAQNTAFPSMAVNSGAVFYTAADGVKSVPKAGGVVSDLSLPQWGASAYALVADDSSLYYSWNGNVWVVDLRTDAYAQAPLGYAPANAATLDPSGLYVTAGLEVRVLTPGAAAGEPLAMELRNPGAIATDDDSVYWLDQGTREPKAIGGRVMKVAKKGGPVVQLGTWTVDDPYWPNAIAVDDQCVYWVYEGVLMRVAKVP